ncbi:MAG: hypothetical protein AAF654_10710 [Myxococcota bacterium]
MHVFFVFAALASPINGAFFAENGYVINVHYSDASGLIFVNGIPVQRLQAGVSSSVQFQPHPLLQAGKNSIRFDGTAKKIELFVRLVPARKMPDEGETVAKLTSPGSTHFEVLKSHVPEYPWSRGSRVDETDCAQAQTLAAQMHGFRTAHDGDGYLASSGVALQTRVLAFPGVPLERLRKTTRTKVARKYEDTYAVDAVGATTCTISESKRLITVTKKGWHGYFVAKDQDFGTYWVEGYVFMKQNGALRLAVIQ